MERGQLSRDILTEDQLQTILGNIREKGHQTLPVSWYYEHTTIDALWSRPDQMAFKVLLPAVTHEVFKMYALQFVPIPVNNSYTRTIRGRTALVLSTESQVAFVPETELCIGRNPISCYPAVQYSAPTCEVDIVLKQKVGRCNVTIAALPDGISQAYRSSYNPFEVTIVPFSREDIVRRCPGKSPRREVISSVTQYWLDRDCSIEGTGWHIRGLQSGNATVHFQRNKPMDFPSLNLSWPTMIPETLKPQFANTHLFTVPITKMISPKRPYNFYNAGPPRYLSAVNSGLLVVSVVCIVVGFVMYHIFIVKRKVIASTLVNAVADRLPEALRPTVLGLFTSEPENVPQPEPDMIEMRVMPED